MKPTDFDKLRRSDRYWGTTWILALAGGWFGAHCFYLGRIVTGLFMAALPVIALSFGRYMTRITLKGFGTVVSCFLLLFICGAVLELIFSLTGAGFLFRKRRGYERFTIGHPTAHFLTSQLERRLGIRTRTPTLPDWFSNMAAMAAFSFVACFVMVHSMLRYDNPSLPETVFLFTGGLTGILYCKDLRSIYYWSITDSLGRALRG